MRRWVRAGARAVAALRIGLGLAALLSPRVAARPWVGGSAGSPAGVVLGPAAGVRDVVLGAGVLVAARQGVPAERDWITAGAVCDAVDATTTFGQWRHLPGPGKVLVAFAAVGATAVAVAAVAVDR